MRFETEFSELFPNFTFIPFGAQIQYKPSSPKVQQQMHAMGSKLLSGIIMGYHEKAGGHFSGDIYFADWEDIGAAERVSEIPVRRVHYKEIKPVYDKNGRFIFPIAEGKLNQPFSLTDMEGKYDVKINVNGGGITGQVEAIRMAIARALCQISEENRPLLKAEGLMTRDPRMVERKKPGQKKARKKFQFSKR